jgi:hypothetical protein
MFRKMTGEKGREAVMKSYNCLEAGRKLTSILGSLKN